MSVVRDVIILVTCNGQTFYINGETRQEQVYQKVAKKRLKFFYIYNIATTLGQEREFLL